MGTGLALPRRKRGGFSPVAASSMCSALSRVLVCCACLVVVSAILIAKDAPKNTDLWSLGALARPEIPQSICSSTNPIDSFIAEACREKGLAPVGPADGLTWLRRVSFDLIGLPPSVEDQESFLRDESTAAVDKVVDRLLASEQYGVRYGRHWLDVL